MRVTEYVLTPLIAAVAFTVPFSSLCQQQTHIIFDVTSVKPASNNSGSGSIKRLDIGTVAVGSMTVYDMIQLFYHVKPYQISGGPEWSKHDRFDVIGKSSTAATMERPKGDALAAAFDDGDEQMRQLLKNRFQLKLHHEAKPLPTLVLQANDKAKFSQVPCSPGYMLQHGLVKGAIRIASLVSLLKVEYGMPVSDGSKLEGCYYIDTRWTNDPHNESLPSIETALSDLGFRLKKITADVDVIVIDHVEKPEPD